MTLKKGSSDLISKGRDTKTMSPETVAASQSEHSKEQSELELLLTQISEGDGHAMREFYQKTVRLVYGMSHRVISNSQEAEEVALEVFMYVWKNASQYDRELSKPLSWLLMITRTRAIDKVRKSSRTVQIDDSVDQDLVTGSDNPEDTYIATERRNIMRSAMSQLTDKQKEVMELSYYHQFSHSEISDHVGIPIGSVKSTIRVAMVKLKNIIKQEQGRLYAAEAH
jgi:RNA polymerase sigma-70 factor, ECF subfamily